MGAWLRFAAKITRKKKVEGNYVVLMKGRGESLRQYGGGLRRGDLKGAQSRRWRRP